ncbi:MAG: hypothetical protein U0Q22_15635 [Acidimicrobiales bacterium]
MVVLAFNPDTPLGGCADEDEFWSTISERCEAVGAAAEQLAKDAPRVVKNTPRFLLARRLERRSPQFLEMARATVEEVTAALLAAIRIMLAAPPVRQVVPVAIVPPPRPNIRGIPIRANAPPAQQPTRCCRTT